MDDSDNFLTLRQFSKRINVSPSAIYRDPLRYHMFKVGSRWRANKESLENFYRKVNNVIRLAVVGKEKKCRSTKEVKRIGWTSQRQTDRELDDLLAPRKK